jgi:hypothetical protein
LSGISDEYLRSRTGLTIGILSGKMVYDVCHNVRNSRQNSPSKKNKDGEGNSRQNSPSKKNKVGKGNSRQNSPSKKNKDGEGNPDKFSNP